eukprot:6104110-Pleurochrysis_carterae.AAC.1
MATAAATERANGVQRGKESPSSGPALAASRSCSTCPGKRDSRVCEWIKEGEGLNGESRGEK